jgi:hypothetical protein
MNTSGRNFGSDNVTPASPEVIDAIAAANTGSVHSYGNDPYTKRVTALVSALFETQVCVYPVSTGTAANALALSVLTPPYGAVYCHEAAHIATDEYGAPEFYTGGAKIIGLPSANGKIVPEQLSAPLRYAEDLGVHHVKPATLSFAQSTEWGTVYTPAEVRALSAAAHAHGLGVHMDGSRGDQEWGSGGRSGGFLRSRPRSRLRITTQARWPIMVEDEVPQRTACSISRGRSLAAKRPSGQCHGGAPCCGPGFASGHPSGTAS